MNQQQPASAIAPSAIDYLGENFSLEQNPTFLEAKLGEMTFPRTFAGAAVRHDELDRCNGLGADLDRRLTRYAGLDPETLPALGADRFPTSSIRAVERGDG